MLAEMNAGRLLSGKVALVTGATSGIGLATAQTFLEEGATLYATGADHVEEAAAKLKGATVLGSDAGSVAAIEELAARIASECGSLDVLMLNAGIVIRADLGAVTEQQFDQVFAVNVKGVLFGAARLAPLMRPGGSIIVTTSIAGHMGLAEGHLYGASKAAARGLVRSMAGELASRGIRVNAIAPGSIETGGLNRDIDPEVRRKLIEAMLARVPLKRRGQPHEIASVALFLATDASSYLTGQEIIVDGGTMGLG